MPVDGVDHLVAATGRHPERRQDVAVGPREPGRQHVARSGRAHLAVDHRLDALAKRRLAREVGGQHLGISAIHATEDLAHGCRAQH